MKENNELSAVNITRTKGNSNYKLLERDAFPLMYVKPHFVVPDGDGWAPAPSVSQWNDKKNPLANVVGVRGARKQRAAKCHIPRESIKIVPRKPPVHVLEGIAIYEGRSEAEVEKARLKGRLCEMLAELTEGDV